MATGRSSRTGVRRLFRLASISRRLQAPSADARETCGLARLAPLLVGVFALAACGGALRLGDLDPPDDRQMVVDVSIEGTDEVSESKILDRIATHSKNLSITGDKPLLDRAQLPADAKRIESIYAAHGFFEARTLEYEVKERDTKTVRVVFHVSEGRPTRITELHFRGITKSEVMGEDEQSVRLREVRDDYADLVPFEVGDIWTEEDYEEGKEAIKKALRDRGFIYAEVVGDVYVQRPTQEAQVYFRVAHGPLTRVGEVTVVGSDAITAERIMRRVDIEPDDIIEPDLLADTEKNIYDLAVFFSVNAEPVRPTLAEKLGGAPATYRNINALEWEPVVPVEVSVQEMPLNEVRAGIGASIDSKRSEAYVSGGYQNRNLFGGLRFFDVTLRPALVLLPGFFDPATIAPGGAADLVFRQPSLIEEYLVLSVLSSYELEVDYGFQSHKVMASPSLSRKFFGYLTLLVGYTAEYRDFFKVSEALSLPFDETLGLAFRDKYLLSYLVQAAAADLRDNVYDPRNGAYISAEVQEALNAIGSDFHYYRLIGDIRGYVTPFEALTLAARVQYGHIFNELGGEVPLSARFRGGGASDMRGFGAGRMGPVVCAKDDNTTTVTSDDVGCPEGAGEPVYVGGNVMFQASFETRFYLPADFGVVAFVDFGEVWAQVEDLSFETLEVAVGPGFRYYTPFGPIRVDLGFLLTTPSPPGFAFHFSIGQAF